MTQKDMRTDFEGYIEDVLSGELLSNARQFAAFLRANEMTAGGAHGEVSYRGQCVCYMHLDGNDQQPGPWTIWTDGDYQSAEEGVRFDEHMKEVAWAHVNFCAACGGGCQPGTRKVIFGRQFDNVCSADMAFHAPAGEVLVCAKKLLEMRKLAIDAGQ